MPKLANSDPEAFLTTNGDRKQLAVLLHSYNGDPGSLATIADAINRETVLPHTDVFCPPLPLTLFSKDD